MFWNLYDQLSNQSKTRTNPIDRAVWVEHLKNVLNDSNISHNINLDEFISKTRSKY